MTTRLDWRAAGQQDRQLLEGFSCTSEAPRDSQRRPLPHPLKWERDVEAGLRALKPPVDGALLLGMSGADLAAVAYVRTSSFDGEVLDVKLAAVAVALRYRHQGYGAESLDVALLAAAELGMEVGARLVRAIGWVHGRNEYSRRLVSGVLDHEGDAGDGYELWGVDLELVDHPPVQPGATAPPSSS